jgi:phosphoglycerate kinase
MSKLSLKDLSLKGKKVLMRVDFNVPLNADKTISDDTRIKESLPSIQHILKQGGCVVLMSHLGKPKAKKNLEFSLAPCATSLSALLQQPVIFAEDCIGPETTKKVADLKTGQVLLLENLRFYAAEEDPTTDPSFAQKLAKYGDVYVNDAFGTAHRAHSSTAIIAQYFPGKAAMGLLMEKEISFLSALLYNPKRPFYAIIGGAKISSKMGVLKSLLSKADGIFIGGGMAYTFFQVQGIPIGESIHENDLLDTANNFLNECAKKKIPYWLPQDLVIADAFSKDANSKIISSKDGIPPGWQGMDVGPQTLKQWLLQLQNASTIFWNGPLGVFEFPKFAQGTFQFAQALANLSSIRVVGGGDSVAAINALSLSSSFSHVSTGGGASLEFIEFGHLPGIDALSNK